MRYVDGKKETVKMTLDNNYKVNEKILTKGTVIVFKEEKDSDEDIILEKSVRINEHVISKGEVISVVGSLKEDYGWEIRRGKEWDAFEDAVDNFGAEEVADGLARAMGSDELGETLAFMFRNWDYQSPYLK